MNRMSVVRVSGMVSAVFLVSLMLGCADKVSREELANRIRGQSPPVIIDVRSLSEFEVGHVPGAIHIPFYSILGSSDRLPKGEDEQLLVVYCEHGPRAGLARAQLWFVSDQPVRFLEGHMIAWREDGFPVAVESDAGVLVSGER